TWVAKRWGYGFSYAAAGMTQAIGTMVAILATAPAVVFGAITLGATIVGLTAIGLVHARNLTPHDPRLVLGLMTGAFGVGQIIGPLFAGIITDATGTLTLSLLGAAVALVGCALLTPQAMPRGTGSVG
ncbi:MAG: YbfB/YjiJ family MFS transporter, partial [Hyphomicrobiaceae bacterium]